MRTGISTCSKVELFKRFRRPLETLQPSEVLDWFFPERQVYEEGLS